MPEKKGRLRVNAAKSKVTLLGEEESSVSVDEWKVVCMFQSIFWVCVFDELSTDGAECAGSVRSLVNARSYELNMQGCCTYGLTHGFAKKKRLECWARKETGSR